MAANTGIEWTDATWNPLVGCSIVSPGCTNCYAMKMAARLEKMMPATRPGGQLPNHYTALTKSVNGNAVWTGMVTIATDHILTQPLHWKKPRRIFVNSMGDLFHETVPDEWIDRVFAVMALAPQHAFQCLTKRSRRMRIYCSAPDVTHRIAKAIDGILVDLEHDPLEWWAAIPEFPNYQASTHGRVKRDGTVLKEQINERFDRPSVTLWDDNEPTTRWVHTLVLNAHRGPPKDGEEARHRNGNPRDNRLANLQWATRDINQQDKVRHGSNGGPAKISREDAATIRAAAAARETQQSIADRYGVSRSLVSMIKDRKVWPDAFAWPLPNCWLGVSAEDQRRAEERIPDLLATPAAIRFVSAEPLLSNIDFTEWLHDSDCGYTSSMMGDCTCSEPREVHIDWIIAGGESGPDARPMHPDWARSIRDQCAAAGVAFLFKQWGEWHPVHQLLADGNSNTMTGREHPDKWHEATLSGRVGKARAGRLLDGIEHNAVPEVRG